MKKKLIWFIGVVIFSVLLMIVGQANAACDVDYDGENLDIKCDGAADTIIVDDVNLVVNGENLGPIADLKDIVIKSGDGNDFVRIHNVEVSGSIEVKSGKGADIVHVVYVIVENDLKIWTDQDADKILIGIRLNVGNDVDIKTGEGNDEVHALDWWGLGGVTAGNDIKIDGKNGTDTLTCEEALYADNEIELRRFEIFGDCLEAPW